MRFKILISNSNSNVKSRCGVLQMSKQIWNYLNRGFGGCIRPIPLGGGCNTSPKRAGASN